MRQYILLTIATLALVYYSNVMKVDSGVKKVELERSCQTGVLLYVTKYPEILDVYEKRSRIAYISEVCGKFANTYMEVK